MGPREHPTRLETQRQPGDNDGVIELDQDEHRKHKKHQEHEPEPEHGHQNQDQHQKLKRDQEEQELEGKPEQGQEQIQYQQQHHPQRQHHHSSKAGRPITQGRTSPSSTLLNKASFSSSLRRESSLMQSGDAHEASVRDHRAPSLLSKRLKKTSMHGMHRNGRRMDMDATSSLEGGDRHADADDDAMGSVEVAVEANGNTVTLLQHGRRSLSSLSSSSSSSSRQHHAASRHHGSSRFDHALVQHQFRTEDMPLDKAQKHQQQQQHDGVKPSSLISTSKHEDPKMGKEVGGKALTLPKHIEATERTDGEHARDGAKGVDVLLQKKHRKEGEGEGDERAPPPIKTMHRDKGREIITRVVTAAHSAEDSSLTQLSSHQKGEATEGISNGALIAIVVSIAVVVAIILFILFRKYQEFRIRRRLQKASARQTASNTTPVPKSPRKVEEQGGTVLTPTPAKTVVEKTDYRKLRSRQSGADVDGKS